MLEQGSIYREPLWASAFIGDRRIRHRSLSGLSLQRHADSMFGANAETRYTGSDVSRPNSCTPAFQSSEIHQWPPQCGQDRKDGWRCLSQAPTLATLQLPRQGVGHRRKDRNFDTIHRSCNPINRGVSASESWHDPTDPHVPETIRPLRVHAQEGRK